MSDKLESNMRVLDAALAKLMPADRAENYRKECADRDAKNAALKEKLRAECAETITLLAEAIRLPSICREDLKNALSHLSIALVAAHELDPED